MKDNCQSRNQTNLPEKKDKNGVIIPVPGNECQEGNGFGIRAQESLTSNSLYAHILFFTMTHQDLVESSIPLGLPAFPTWGEAYGIYPFVHRAYYRLLSH